MSPETDPHTENLTKRKPSEFFRVFCGYSMTILGIALFVVHFFQFDRLAPVTLVPPWLWLVPAILLIGLSFRSMSRWHLLVATLVWLAFIIFFVEEARSLIRSNNLSQRSTETDDQSKTIRVTTLNCQVGSPEAAMEVQPFAPDVVLLQESPGKSLLKTITHSLLGEQAEFLSCGDTSILARGKLTPIMSDPSSHFAHAVVTLADGQQIDVVSLRLSPPVFRMDFWTSRFWNDHLETRRKHRRQLQQIVDHLEKSAQSAHWIIGGDFNLVGNDGALSAFQALKDSFSTAGSGWSNTGTSQYPLFRVDQIWTNHSLECQGHRTIRTQHSDHRMVVVDLKLAK